MNYGRYNIVSELGRGAMGMVYQAHDPQIDRMVALKVLREDRLTTEDYVQRFLKEATAIGRLSHPGIVTVFDVGQDHGTIYIAMEFLEGEALDLVLKNGNLTIQDIVTIGIQVSQALQYAHKKGIVHRDIKPPNILYTPEKTIKVTDFGIAHIDDPDGQQMTRAGEILGTPVYMAPEQVMGQTVDGRSDLYSLGVILYELTTGSRPFQGDNLAAVFRAITHDTPVAPHQINPDVPPALSDLILKAMAKKPEERFATGQELADRLDNCLNSQPQDAFTETVIQETPPKKRSNSGFLLLTLLLLCGGGLAAYFYFLPPTTDNNLMQATEQSQEMLPVQEERPIPPTIVPDSSKSITEPVKKIKPESDATVAPPPVEVPPTDRFKQQQATESIEELFSENKKEDPEPKPAVDSPEPKLKSVPPTAVPKTKTEKVPVITATPPVKEEIKPLPPPQKAQQKNPMQKMATLTMNSNPPGASLYVDGEYRGLTPVNVEITADKHEVKLELQGHLGWQAQLNLSKGGKIPITIPLPTE